MTALPWDPNTPTTPIRHVKRAERLHTKGLVISMNRRNAAMLVCRLWILLGLLLAGCNESASGPPFDTDIEGFELVKLITGDDAIKEINKLHGMPIDIVRGFIAHYQGVDDKATIWVSEASSQKLATEQIAVMMDKMKGNRRSPFSHYRTFNTKGFEIMAFDGMGQAHYVFRDGNWVYWISANSIRMDKILQNVHKRR